MAAVLQMQTECPSAGCGSRALQIGLLLSLESALSLLILGALALLMAAGRREMKGLM